MQLHRASRSCAHEVVDNNIPVCVQVSPAEMLDGDAYFTRATADRSYTCYLRRKPSGKEEVLLDLNDLAASGASLGQVLWLLVSSKAADISQNNRHRSTCDPVHESIATADMKSFGEANTCSTIVECEP